MRGRTSRDPPAALQQPPRRSIVADIKLQLDQSWADHVAGNRADPRWLASTRRALAEAQCKRLQVQLRRGVLARSERQALHAEHQAADLEDHRGWQTLMIAEVRACVWEDRYKQCLRRVDAMTGGLID